MLRKTESPWKRRPRKEGRLIRREIFEDKGIEIHYEDNDVDEEDLGEEEDPALSATLVEDKVYSTFYALVHLSEAAARRRMPRAIVTDGIFPNQIYTEIFKQVTEIETRESFMNVSRTFPRICQDLLFADDLIFEPSDACQGCNNADDLPGWYEKYDVGLGTQSQVKVRRAGGFPCSGDKSWKVIIGTGHDKKNLLIEAAFAFNKV